MGNFLSLLKFRVDAGNKILEEHLLTAGRNAMYTSKDIQNDFIKICGNIIRNKIIITKDMCRREAKFFLLLLMRPAFALLKEILLKRSSLVFTIVLQVRQ